MNDDARADALVIAWLEQSGIGWVGATREGTLIAAIAAALRDARRAERERCAQVAERWGGHKGAVIATEIRALTD